MDLELLKNIWRHFFPNDVSTALHPQDPRIEIIQCFVQFFTQDIVGKQLIAEKSNEFLSLKRFYLDVQVLNGSLPFNDFEDTLINRPMELTGCMGLAISAIANAQYIYLEKKLVIFAAFYNLSTTVRFDDIKAGKVGQLVAIEGQVLRVSNNKIMVDGGYFKCAKCNQLHLEYFEDGIFNPPVVCPTKKCYNKYLEFDRSTALLSDYQTVKLNPLTSQLINSTNTNTSNSNSKNINNTEQYQDEHNSNDHSAPKVMEVELRGDLVNTIGTGDCIRIVGIVNTMQLEGGRYFQSGAGGGGRGYKESALHVLYINTLSIESLATSSNSQSRKTSSIIQASKSKLARDFTEEQELRWIRSLALSNTALPVLIHSLCPGIYGHELVKLGLILVMLGGTDQTIDEEYHPHHHQQQQQSTQTHSSSQQSASNTSNPTTNTTNTTTNEGESFVRSNIHILVVGDPGLGKSQMLRAAAAASPRAVLVTGNTSSAAGLTASMTRDSRKGGGGGKGGSDGNGSGMEAGALVLADGGLCCIDELDKIACDTHVLLEAMEQQTLSMAKAGMVCTLRCRTAIAAAANPVQGHYNRQKSICENLKMNAALLSRFDLIFILLDRPDEAYDKLIGEHILDYNVHNSNSNSRAKEDDDYSNKRQRMMSTQDFSNTSNTFDQGNNHVNSEEILTLKQRVKRQVNHLRNSNNAHSQNYLPQLQCLSTEEIRRYLQYARQFVHPRLSREAAKVLQKMYLTMRAEDTTSAFSGSNSNSGSLPVTTRHLESLIRLSQARAKIDLRDEVTEQDAQDVVQLLQESMLDVLTDSTGAVDRSRRGNGIMSMSLAKQMKALAQAMAREARLNKQGSSMFSKQEIKQLADMLRLDKDLDALIDLMRTECYLLLKGPRLYELRIM